jgi:hypothetical protein
VKNKKKKKSKKVFFLFKLTRHIGRLISHLRQAKREHQTRRDSRAAAHVDQFELAQIALVLRARLKVKQRHKVHWRVRATVSSLDPTQKNVNHRSLFAVTICDLKDASHQDEMC